MSLHARCAAALPALTSAGKDLRLLGFRVIFIALCVAVMSLLLAGGVASMQSAFAREAAISRAAYRGAHKPMTPIAPVVRQAPLPSQADMLARERLEFDKAKAAFDQNIGNQKMELERKKLVNDNARIELENSKNRWTAASTIFPVLGVLATLAFSIYSFRKQQGLQIESQNETARLNFEIKAAEIAFAGKTPYAVQNRGRALRQMFSNRLRTDFLTNFRPEDFGGDAEPATQKLALLELLAKYPNQRNEILTDWANLFPGDSAWFARVTQLAQTGPTSPAGGNAPTGTPPRNPGTPP
jgi:hypothetical protein